MQYSLFDFHRHFNTSKKRDDAFYCTSSLDEWLDNGEFYSLGLLLSDKIYLSEDISAITRKLEKLLIENPNAQIERLVWTRDLANQICRKPFL